MTSEEELQGGGETPTVIPLSYRDGYEAARRVEPELADRYIRYTTQGDPVGDAVVEELAENATPLQVHGIIASTLDNWDDLPAGTPDSLRQLVATSSVMPDWFDRELAMEGTRGFLRHSDMVLGGLIGGAIIEGFSTLISKSFRIRSRITTNGVRRLKQNMLQLLDQFLPGGMETGADGWKLSLRIRLVHAQARMLIKRGAGQDDWNEWDHDVYGMPLSTAHMLLGAASFSGRLMQHVANLGSRFSEREREGYVHVWRYAGQILGVPEEIMFRDFAECLRIFKVGVLCEPEPDDDAIIMANSIVNSAPFVLGVTDPAERRSLAKFVYQVSRELIGNELADKFRFPPGKFKKELPFLRLKNYGEAVLRTVVPKYGAIRSRRRFQELLKSASLEGAGYEHSYSLPSSVFDDESHAW